MTNWSADEINFEYLTTWPVNQVLLSTWNDWGATNGKHHYVSATVRGLSRGEWTLLNIRWYPYKVEWYVNNALVYSTTNALANDPMNVRSEFVGAG